MKRRTLLKGTLATGAAIAAVGSGLVTPRAVMAAWSKSAFEAKSVDEAVNALFGAGTLEGSGKIKLKAPDIAENGRVVPVSVTADIDGVESIAVLVEKNPNPLAAAFTLGAGAEGYIATRIKMGKTSSVIAAVKANGKLYSAGKEVKVTIGGCGG